MIWSISNHGPIYIFSKHPYCGWPLFSEPLRVFYGLLSQCQNFNFFFPWVRARAGPWVSKNKLVGGARALTQWKKKSGRSPTEQDGGAIEGHSGGDIGVPQQAYDKPEQICLYICMSVYCLIWLVLFRRYSYVFLYCTLSAPLFWKERCE